MIYSIYKKISHNCQIQEHVVSQTHFWFHKHPSLTLEKGCESATGQFNVCSGVLFKPAT